MLEPSPPAVTDGPWYADDPVARGDGPGRVVSPVPTGDLLWSALAAGDPALAAFCRERWLGPFKRLARLPPGFDRARRALHEIAETVMKPARERATGKIGLRYTFGGFGTPFFGADEQIRVEHGVLLAGDRREVVTEREPAAALGDWYGFAFSVLEELRATHPGRDPSRVQLWPEHFDASLDLGSVRAGYGASPGDDDHPEPYLYVAPWEARPAGDLWQATGFQGAELPYASLLAVTDQRSVALEFFESRLAALHA